MHVNLYEITAFTISLCTFIYGIIFLSQKSDYNKLFLYASGCYLLEELWVIVNLLFGHIEGLVTVRLVGLFGTYCFLLTASVKQFETIKKVDESINKRSIIIPIILLIIFGLNSINYSGVQIILGIALTLPIVFASYYNSKAILLSNRYKVLKDNKMINLISLLFYILNLIYLFPVITSSKILLEIFDIIASLVIFSLIFLNKRGVNSE